jgi:hypothetical protein
VKTGDEFLICFQHDDEGLKRVVQLINLSQPSAVGVKNIAVTSELRILMDGKWIIEVFRKRMKERPKSDPVKIDDYTKDYRFELEPNMEPYNAVYAGSACYLRIPKDLTPKKKK